MLLVAVLAILLVIAPTIFFACTLFSYGGSVPNVIVPVSNTGFASGPPNTGTLEESEKDAFTLQPNDHIFRESQTIRATWNITMEEREPDGVKKMVYLVNGKQPPPQCEVRQHTYIDCRPISRANY